jgi:Flp pilus assembly protein TadG
MPRRVTSICRRFAASTRGIAAVEFAIIVPILLILFLTTFDAANGVAVYMKVRAATYTLAAVTNQYGTGSDEIGTTDMAAITGAAGAVLSPYSSTPTVVTISQIEATSNTQAVVSWSYSLNGVALAQGTAFPGLPSNFGADTCGGSYPCYAILASVSYAYTPVFGTFLTGPVVLADSLYVTPRVSACIQYNSVPSAC